MQLLLAPGAAIAETGVVFIGAALEPYLRAFETRPGKELWKGQLPTSARATPLIYMSARGRQMVAFAGSGVRSSIQILAMLQHCALID